MLRVDNRQNRNPFINLAIEEYLLQQADTSSQRYLFLYVNEPCVVVGRNQSIYSEVNMEVLSSDLPVCRRITGGGTVYHDTGNLNFSFIESFAQEKVSNYRYFNTPLVNALCKVGIPAETDDRNNIIAAGKKISGNAQFTNRKNIISHGTLLLHADLEKLRWALKKNQFEIITSAVRSVPSPVANISQFSGAFSNIERLADYVAEELGANETYTFSDEQWQHIENLATQKFNSIKWIYGRCPKTVLYKPACTIYTEDGVVTFIEPDTHPAVAVKGMLFHYENIKKALEQHPNALQILRDLF